MKADKVKEIIEHNEAIKNCCFKECFDELTEKEERIVIDVYNETEATNPDISKKNYSETDDLRNWFEDTFKDFEFKKY